MTKDSKAKKKDAVTAAPEAVAVAEVKAVVAKVEPTPAPTVAAAPVNLKVAATLAKRELKERQRVASLGSSHKA